MRVFNRLHLMQGRQEYTVFSSLNELCRHLVFYIFVHYFEEIELALRKSYTVDFRWVLQAGIALSEKNPALEKGLLLGRCFPRGRLPHPLQVPPALKASRAAGDIAVPQSGAGGLSAVCPAQPPQAESDLATPQHLVFALESDVPQPKEEEREHLDRLSLRGRPKLHGAQEVNEEPWVLKTE